MKIKIEQLKQEFAESHGYPDGWEEYIKDVGYKEASLTYKELQKEL